MFKFLRRKNKFPKVGGVAYLVCSKKLLKEVSDSLCFPYLRCRGEHLLIEVEILVYYLPHLGNAPWMVVRDKLGTTSHLPAVSIFEKFSDALNVLLESSVKKE